MSRSIMSIARRVVVALAAVLVISACAPANPGSTSTTTPTASPTADAVLRIVDEKKVSLDDKLSKWLPNVPNSDRVTLGQLAQMTTGYVTMSSATCR